MKESTAYLVHEIVAAPVLTLMEGLRYAVVVHANCHDIAAEARIRFDIEMSDEPPIVQVLGPESWWDAWRDMSAKTRKAAGMWQPRFFELSARLEVRLGIVIECGSLEGAELEDITGARMGCSSGTPKLHIIHRAEGNARDVGATTG